MNRFGTDEKSRAGSEAAVAARADARGGPGAGKVRVRLRDHQGRTRFARLPAGVQIGRIKDRIIEQLEAASVDSTGQAVTFDLTHNGRVLQDDDVLDDLVKPGDELELSPSIQSA
jgi:hypothetical protein